ncbi:hypothetical protein C2E21_6125 [Chlorella sorokiniana]|uniref:Uncharacterized protein n=1 Tax=Chlorella sorokiniana TaxID=3076 RepID=A0A2P6TLJ0_CHLSO|nr:hypothetical protein C2E21_6125 [Chlorella sorokiniana]|eukprot:PRW45162.1 hypothetical protein C2E21_6125 [Chlorella sorokiniana]
MVTTRSRKAKAPEQAEEHAAEEQAPSKAAVQKRQEPEGGEPATAEPAAKRRRQGGGGQEVEEAGEAEEGPGAEAAAEEADEPQAAAKEQQAAEEWAKEAERGEQPGEGGKEQAAGGEASRQGAGAAAAAAAGGKEEEEKVEAGILEQGRVTFLSKVGMEEVESLQDVQRFFMLLQPASGSGGKSRLCVLGKKRLPSARRHERFFGFVEAVADSSEELVQGLGPQQYETKTRGTRHLEAARAVGQGTYALAGHKDHVKLLYRLEVPSTPGEAQLEFTIGEEGAFVMQNPEAHTEGDPGLSERADYSGEKQAEFGSYRWISPRDTQLLDVPRCEFLLIGAREEMPAGLGEQMESEGEAVCSKGAGSDDECMLEQLKQAVQAEKGKQQHRLSRSSSAEPTELLAAIRKGLPTQLPPLDSHTVAKLKEQALKKAADLQQQASQSAKQGLHGARLVAADVARGDANAAGRTLGGLLHRAATSPAAMFVARLLVCLYFLNSVYDSVSTWQWSRQPEVVERARRWPQHYPTVSFPYLSVSLLLPCALLAALGVQVLLTASVLVAWELFDSLNLVWTQLSMLVLNGVQPNELVVKRLAMLGCTALVLAHNMKEQRVVVSSYAGLLLSGDVGRQRLPGRGKSAVLLAGRLLTALLFVYVGISQLQRVLARDFILAAHMPHSRLFEQDGHDNNFLLLEFVLALPFAVGYKTEAVGRLLAATLAAEALTCWRFWADWPTRSYAAHVRLHFMTNLGVAGGLLLLSAMGAGRFAVDALLPKKRE